MYRAGPRQRRHGGNIQHQRPVLSVYGGLRTGRGLHRLDHNRLQKQRHKSGLSPIYATQSYLYEKMGDYKNALKAVRTTNNIRFNERVEEAQSSLAEMQTLFEVGSWNSKSPG